MIEFANDKTLRFEYRHPFTKAWHDTSDYPSFFEDIEYRKKPTKNIICEMARRLARSRNITNRRLIPPIT